VGEIEFACREVAPVAYSVGPTLRFTLEVHDPSDEPVLAIALRCQFRIQPARRHYDDREAGRLGDLFGERHRWPDTQQAMQLATVAVMVPAFTSSTAVDVDVPCTYDMEIATTKYLHSLEGGVVPLLILFSGTVFRAASRGLDVEQVPWHKEVAYGLPVAVWRQMMDDAFPDTGWLRLRRSSIDALRAYATSRALPTHDHVVEQLLQEAGQEVRA
jgi:hypothetical protein